MKTNQSLTIGWLYPDLMSTYGDRGNIITLSKRAEWRGIDTNILPLSLDSNVDNLSSCDLIFMGGAQDRQQKIVSEDFKTKTPKLKEMIEAGVPGLYICGAYQFLGNYYKEADGTVIEGLGILDLCTESPGPSAKRLIGNVIAHSSLVQADLVGFENHGGRTYLGKGVEPLGTVQVGFGNNGRDKTEGAVYKNSLGSYFHGPILPKNPALSDFLLKKALEKKYHETIILSPLDDSLADHARSTIAKRLGTAL